MCKLLFALSGNLVAFSFAGDALYGPSPSPLPAGERDRVRGDGVGCNEIYCVCISIFIRYNVSRRCFFIGFLVMGKVGIPPFPTQNALEI